MLRTLANSKVTELVGLSIPPGRRATTEYKEKSLATGAKLRRRRLHSWVRKSSSPRRSLRCESLEPRTLLAADPIISEFLASNQNSIRDGDRDTSDWIEIYNRGNEPAELSGWHLTDDADELTKWTFPDVTLAPQEHLIVFASGKDTTDGDGALHTNFRLAASGEYLALVQPDGTVSSSEFSPSYPSQISDVSYGLRFDEVGKKFVSADSSAEILVPPDDRFGNSWINPEFEPGDEWLTEISPGIPAKAAIGFEADSGFAR